MSPCQQSMSDPTLTNVQEGMLIAAVNNYTETADCLSKKLGLPKADLGVLLLGMEPQTRQAYITNTLSHESISTMASDKGSSSCYSSKFNPL
jgi:hypothetical protein